MKKLFKMIVVAFSLVWIFVVCPVAMAGWGDNGTTWDTNGEKIDASTDGVVDLAADDDAVTLLTVNLRSDNAYSNNADSDKIVLGLMKAYNSNNEYTTYAWIESTAVSITNGAEEGKIEFKILVSGSETTPITVDSNGLAYSGAFDITGALTATSYGGILEANLVDKNAEETFALQVTFATNPVVAGRTAILSSGTTTEVLYKGTNITSADGTFTQAFPTAYSDGTVPLVMVVYNESVSMGAAGEVTVTNPYASSANPTNFIGNGIGLVDCIWYVLDTK